MKVFILLSALVVVSTAFVARSPAARLKDFLPESRIIGGIEASAGQFAHQVGLSLSNSNGSWWCGGSIIDPNWILTAAHCTYRATKAIVYAGTLNVNKLDSTAQTKVITGSNFFTFHAQYDPETLNNDISVIRLPSPLTLNYYVWPIQLVSRSEVGNSFEGVIAEASGWGKISDASVTITNQLRYVNMVIENQNTCKGYYIAGLVNDDVICTNTASGTKTTCSGDSGGPLTYKGRLIGVTSFVSSRGCGSGGPSGFTRTSSFLDWIKLKTGVDVGRHF